MNAFHNEVDCLTEGVAWFTTALDQADALPARRCRRFDDPATELHEVMPRLLAELSPEARALLRDKHNHVTELVAGLHAALHV